MAEIIIEQALEKHIPEVAQMFVKLWPECIYEEEVTSCRKIVASSDKIVLLARSGVVYVGFIYLALRHDFVEGTTSSPVAYIEGIFVEPDYRNRGIAILLVKTAEDWGFRNGCKELGSDAELNNLDSIAFHKAAGFKEANRVVCFSKTIRE